MPSTMYHDTPETLPAWSELLHWAEKEWGVRSWHPHGFQVTEVCNLGDTDSSLSHNCSIYNIPSKLCLEGLELDFRRQRTHGVIDAALIQLAHQAQLHAQRDAMFSGQAINVTEDRAVLHVALRTPKNPSHNPCWSTEITQQVLIERARLLSFVDSIREGHRVGWGGESFTDVVHIGIGGSDLGPRMASWALVEACPALRVHYLANPDAWNVSQILAPLDPKRTLMIVASKTFTTLETMLNATSVRQWFLDQGCPPHQLSRHLVGVTASPDRAEAFGIPPEHTFVFWDWVGGRFSVWSSLGLPLALAIGRERFEQFLAGAYAMDVHFATSNFTHNLPVRLALYSIWNTQCLHMPTHLMAAYSGRLQDWVPYLQQLEMESLGKSTHLNGQPCAFPTGSIVWGGVGVLGQHAYFQLLHQGRHAVPVDFVMVRHESVALPLANQHLALLQTQCQAQANALQQGRNVEDTLAFLASQASSQTSTLSCEAMVQHRSYLGKQPSTVLTLEQLDPYHLGMLMALYEHKVFCIGALLRINPFDQWGVELGKTFANAMQNNTK